MITRMDVQLRFARSIALYTGHIAKNRDDEHKISAVTVTPFLSDGISFGEPNTVYFIDGDEREFNDIDSLIDAYNELYQHSEDNPETEIVYVKTIRKRKKI